MSVRLSSSLQPRQLLESSPCPGLYCPIVAQDGVLSRIRLPGGLLSAEQCRVLAEVSQRLGGTIDITNRANVQIRGLQAGLSAASLQQLQLAGLAASPDTDHLRNIMASPTAGIDPAQLVDTHPLVKALDCYLSSQPQLADLSAKFSIGMDGGEQVSIAQQLNDLTFSALKLESNLYFTARLRGMEPSQASLLEPKACQPFVAALAQTYLETSRTLSPSKPRLKSVIESVGSQAFLSRLQSQLDFPLALSAGTNIDLRTSVRPSFHLGVHPQRQPGLFYIGAAVPLGHLDANQLIQLAALSQSCGSGTIRLTPWRNLLISDVLHAQADFVVQSLEALGLPVSATSPWSGLIACSGQTGCAASATDTQADAAAIAAAISPEMLDQPIHIHLTGCAKSCAYHGSSDITLVGQAEAQTSYQLFVGDLESPFGRLLMTLTPDDVAAQVLRLIQVYQQRRSAPAETFCAFVNEWPVAQLQNWMIVERG